MFSNLFLKFILFTCIILVVVNYTEPGRSNLHTYDGVSTAEVIGGDIFFEIVSPSELSYTYRLRPAKDFGVPFNSSFHIEKVPLVPTVPKFCCNIPLNVKALVGNVALIERGECSFKAKTIIAEKAGAKAVIITDASSFNEDTYIEMIDDDTSEEASIPAGFLLGKNGWIIRKTLKELKRDYAIINLPVNLTFTPVWEFNQPPWLGW